ncbi:hypothetical protein B0H12DRAFT_194456 [Mycena haematopus]|nr:hypothetical protein B0H12DRAFT_194456 [Mycena haematopus]
MLTFMCWMLAIGKRPFATRDDAPTMPPATRQRTRKRTSSLKGTSTCSCHSLHVTITSAPHVQDVLAAATCVRTASLPPVFVLKHTAANLDASPSMSASSSTSTVSATHTCLLIDRGNLTRTRSSSRMRTRTRRISHHNAGNACTSRPRLNT